VKFRFVRFWNRIAQFGYVSDCVREVYWRANLRRMVDSRAYARRRLSSRQHRDWNKLASSGCGACPTRHATADTAS
jgi:hypothetical protein